MFRFFMILPWSGLSCRKVLAVVYFKYMKIDWREVFKFLSGAAFVGSAANLYLYLNNVAIPFLGYTIAPQLLGLRAFVGFILFLVFFYFGYLKKK